MRPILLAVVVAAASLLAIGCGNSCQDLGERLCKCSTPGVTKSACIDNVKAEITRLHPNGSDKDACSQALDTCYPRQDPDTGESIRFCDWVSGRCGKASCGMSQEDYATLSGYDESDPENPKPLTPDPEAPSKALCPM